MDVRIGDAAAVQLVQFPARRPRVVASGEMGPVAEIVRVNARRARALWTLSRYWPLRDHLWIPADEAVRGAWDTGMIALGSPQGDLAVGLVGERGPRQKLTLVVPGSPWVAKVALEASARRSIEREADNYDLLQASGLLRGAIPNHRRAGEVLLVERVEGPHPTWDSRSAAEWILESLQAPDGGGIQHGDVTPWNVIRAHDGYRLIDWEDANLAGGVDPLFNVLDFVIRGAALSRSAPAKVNSLLSGYLQGRRVETLNAYESYRRRLTDGRIDALKARSETYLRHLARTSRS